MPEKSTQDDFVPTDRSNKPAALEQEPLPRKSSLKAPAGLPKVGSGVTENEEHTGKLSIKAGENTDQLSQGEMMVDEVSRLEIK